MKGLLFISHKTEKYDYLQSIDIALQGGCKKIQLRMKEAFVDEVEETAQEAKKRCMKYQAELYIDDYVEICLRVGAAGIHLGKTDMPVKKAREILGNQFVIGATANTFDDIKKLNDDGVNYIGLGPFRFTTTKKNLSPVLGLQGYRDIINECQKYSIKLPILAIGGITINDIPDIINAGVSGIALSSTILNAENPIEETKRIISLINNI